MSIIRLGSVPQLQNQPQRKDLGGKRRPVSTKLIRDTCHKAVVAIGLTLVDSSVLEDELIDELESLRLGSGLQVSQKWIVREVVLSRSLHTCYVLTILNSAVTIVTVVLTKPFL
jgi:hypothetical protein